MSQNFDLGLSFDFKTKKREDLVDFFLLNFLHFIKLSNKIKAKAYIKNLRHCSLYINVIYKYYKSCASKYIIKRDIIVKKIKVENLFFKFSTTQLIYFFIHKYMVYIVKYHYSLPL